MLNNIEKVFKTHMFDFNSKQKEEHFFMKVGKRIFF